MFKKLKFLALIAIIFATIKIYSTPPGPFISPQASTLPTPTPIPTPTPSPTSTLTLTPSPSPVSNPTPSPSPQPQFTPEQIHGFIDQYSNQYSLNPHQLRHIAVCESSFNPSAKNLTYAGLFQFSPNTWIKYRNLLSEDPDPNLRFNAQSSVKTAAYVMSLGQTYIWPNCF